MLRGWLALAIVLCTSACVDSEEPSPDAGLTPGEDVQVAITAGLAEPHDSYNVCDHLPETPPCSLLCDRDALVDYVPTNSCAVFACELTDGTTAAVHVCHPDD